MAFVALLKANSTKSKKNTFMLVTHAKYTVVTRHGVFYCSIAASSSHAFFNAINTQGRA